MSPDDASSALRTIAESLLKDREALGEAVAQTIMENEPAYVSSQAVSPSVLHAAVMANITELFHSLAGKPQDVAVFEEIGSRRAESNFPLHAVLHAYRIGGSFYWDRFAREALEESHSDQIVIEGTRKFGQIIDVAADRVTWAYQETLDQMNRADLGRRNDLIDFILSGSRGSDGALWDAATSLRLPTTGQFVVVVAATESYQSVLSHFSKEIEAARCTSVWRTYEQSEIGLISLTKTSHTFGVLQLLDSLAKGPTGVSESFGDLRWAPRALRQARIACDTSRGNPVGATPFATVPMQAMLVDAPGSAEDLRRFVLGGLLQVGDEEQRDLIATIRALANAEGSVSECASRMYLHRNSVYRRLDRVHELTGRNPQTPIGMAELYIAIEADRILSHRADADMANSENSLTTKIHISGVGGNEAGCVPDNHLTTNKAASSSTRPL